jgi:branched-chain amino acid transport system substrate-binding protein
LHLGFFASTDRAHAALCSILALLAAACPAGSDVQEATPRCPDEEFGCLAVGPKEHIRIGTVLEVSGGPYARLGRDAQRGAHLAADFLDPPREVLGHTIRWADHDDLCGGEDGVFPRDPEMVAVIGTTCSRAAFGIADAMYSDRGMVLISPSNRNPGLTHPASHHPFYFRTAHNDVLQGPAVAEFATETIMKRAATIHDQSPYAELLQEAFAEDFRHRGGTIVAQEAIQPGDTDFIPLLQELATKDIDLLYLPIFVAEAALIVRQARAIPELDETVLVGSDALLTSELVKASGQRSVEGFFVSAPISAYQSSRPSYINQFLRRYKEKFGEVPRSEAAAYAFDAATLVFEAIEKAAVRLPGGRLLIPRTGLRNVLLETRNFAGVTGTLTCNENGDCQPETRIAIYSIEKGDFLDEPSFVTTVRLNDLGRPAESK